MVSERDLYLSPDTECPCALAWLTVLVAGILFFTILPNLLALQELQCPCQHIFILWILSKTTSDNRLN